MALFFIGEKCSLCGKEMRDINQIFSFPHFTQNTKDPVYKFTDSTFHVKCLHKEHWGNTAIKLADQYIFSTRPANRICIVSGSLIKDFDDYIFIDLLTSDEHEDLYEFNFTTIDRNNLKKWTDRDRFVIIATKFKDENKWGEWGSYGYLDNLIKRIKG